MFSSQEYQFIKDLTINFYNKDYKSYLCYTNNENNYNTSYYDVICYYSKNNLTLNNYSLSIPNDSVKCSFDSKNSYSNYKNNSSLNCSVTSDKSYSINSKEFIYSNVGYNSNIIEEYTTNLNYYNRINLVATAILSVLIILFLYKFVSKILRS